MKIVIDIEESRYNWIMSHASKHPYDYADAGDLFFRTAVERGIVLPKEHGRLIDADAYRIEMMNSREFDFFKILDMQPTIIDAE